MTSLFDGLTAAVVQDAWRRTARGPSAPPPDLELMRARLRCGTWVPGALTRRIRLRPDGRVRLLGVPGLADRCAQRAVLSLAEGPASRALGPHVHGYRPGRSVGSAVFDLCRQVGDRPVGAVVQADVVEMFDQLPASLVSACAAAAWGDPLWRLLATRWTTAWSVGGRGVPQGAPLSPLLANLTLAEVVDRELQCCPPRELLGWIRYGDDLTLVLGPGGSALGALRDLQEHLARHGLALSRAKSKISRPSGVPPVVLGQLLRWRRLGSRCTLGLPSGLGPGPTGSLLAQARPAWWGQDPAPAKAPTDGR